MLKNLRIIELSKLKKIFILFLIFTIVTVTFNLGPVLSDEVSDIEGEIEETEEEIRTREAILAQTQEYIDQILSSNLSIDQKIAALQEEIDVMSQEIRESEEKLSQKDEEISKKQEEVNKKIEGLKSVSQNLYKSSRLTLLELLLSEDSSGDLLRSYGFKKYAFNSQSVALKDLNDQMDALEYEKFVLDTEREMLDEEMAALEESKSQLDEQKSIIMQQLYAQAAAQANLEQEIVALNNQLDQLSADLQAAIIAKAGSGGGGSGGGNSNGGTSPQPPSGNPGQYDLYTDCEIANGQYINCNQIADNVSGPVRVLSQSNENVFEVELWRKYRGVLEFRADTNVYMINELPFELYLRGIGEMPSSWPAEALKSQAIAARTYAAKNWNKRLGDKYNLRSDVYDQNYVGYNKEVEANYGQNWVNAVTGTTYKTLYHGGALIGAYYHSTCGGHTLGSEEVWVSALPYTRPESDWYQSGGVWHSYDEASPWSYKKWGTASIDDTQMIDLINASLYLGVDVNSEERQNHIRRPDLGGWSAQQIESALGAGNRIQDIIGTITNVQSIYNNNSTSIDGSAKATTKVRVTGTNGSYDIDWYVFWIVYNSRSPGDLTLYWSNFWTSMKEGNSWNFYSRGYPHRVGMCQYGAYGRANAGQTYSEILTHYYEGTSIGDFAATTEFRVGITSLTDGDTFITNIVGGDYDIFANGQHIATVNSSNTLRIVKQ